MDSLWKCDQLEGVKEYEELKRLVQICNFDQGGEVKTVLFEKLNLLLHQLSVIAQKDLQLKFLGNVLAWFKKNSVVMEQEQSFSPSYPSSPQSVVSQCPPLGRRRAMKSESRMNHEDEIKKPNISLLQEQRFHKSKQKHLSHWGIDRSRSSENFLYKFEVKSISQDRRPRHTSSSHHLKNLKKVYKKHKKLINPHFFKFQEEAPDPLPFLSSNMKEIEDLKRALSKKGVVVSSKLIEPLNFYQSPIKPSHPLTRPDLSPENFPLGGESLLKKMRIVK